MTIRAIIRLFKTHSVSVYGERGAGKDMLFGNVIAYRKKPYVSNMDYGGKRYEYHYKDIDIGSVYRDFNSGTLKKYIYPYPDGTDIYLSDCGIYFPAQYCNELNKEYKSLPVFFALCRHLADASMHTNSQALNRVWDKLREQSVSFIQCIGICKWILKLTKGRLVVQRIRIYDKYESALEKRLPLRIHLPWNASREAKANRRIKEDEYISAHGHIRERTLIYINKAKYNTRAFKEMLENADTK